MQNLLDTLICVGHVHARGRMQDINDKLEPQAISNNEGAGAWRRHCGPMSESVNSGCALSRMDTVQRIHIPLITGHDYYSDQPWSP